MKKTPKINVNVEIQRTFWFELTRLAAFFRSKRLLKQINNKPIFHIHIDGKKTETILFDYKKAMA